MRVAARVAAARLTAEREGAVGRPPGLMRNTSAFPGGVASGRGGDLSGEARQVWGAASLWGTRARGSGVHILQGWREECPLL